MNRLFLVSVATATLVGTTGFSLAQAPNEKSNAPAAQAAPAEKTAPPDKAAPGKVVPPMNRTEGPAPKLDGGMKGSQADQKPQSDKGSMQRVQEQNKDPVQPNRAASDTSGPKATGKSSADMKAKDQPSSTKSASETNAEKSRNGLKSAKSNATTGQAGAGSKQLTTEQRTSIRAVISEQHVQPAQNVNFSISIGTRVPRTVSYYPLPPQLVTIYPDWRGYQYFLVGDQIIVVNPRTHEIVAVLEA